MMQSTDLRNTQQLAEDGDVAAQLQLGKLRLGQERYEEAASWLHRAAQQENAEAQCLNLEHAPRTIIEARKTFDVTLAALGKKMGTTESAMSRLESDHYRTANLQKVIRIATAIASFRS